MSADTTQPRRCKAEEWHRDGRGLWAMRACVRDTQHGGRHEFGVWRYNVNPALRAPSGVPEDRSR
jgi:hypothetical protein